MKGLFVATVSLLLLAGLVYSFAQRPQAPQAVDPTPQPMVLSGVFECLPHRGDGPTTMECAFGVRADDGRYYAVNFGASAGAMERFMAGERMQAEGFFVPQEALSTDQWAKYDIRGIFTVTRFLDAPAAAGKLDVRAVCESALMYMTFPDGAAAEAFVAECVEGKHPEVIERYKADNGLGDGAAI